MCWPQVLQLVVGCMKHADHNVVAASLEVLHQILKHASLPLRAVLVSRGNVASLLSQTVQHVQSMFINMSIRTLCIFHFFHVSICPCLL